MGLGIRRKGKYGECEQLSENSDLFDTDCEYWIFHCGLEAGKSVSMTRNAINRKHPR